MRKETDAHLVRPLDDTIVAAKLIIGVTVDEIDEAVGLWSPYLTQQIQAGIGRPQHAHWEWERKARAVNGLLAYTFCGITVETEMQALMLREDTFARAKHPDQRGMPIVYVPFLATAPWNDKEIVPTPAYRGCGTILLKESVDYSHTIGYKGRVGLHSLPQAEGFYRDRCKMVDLGVDPDPEHQNLRYFEFTNEAARTFLRNINT